MKHISLFVLLILSGSCKEAKELKHPIADQFTMSVASKDSAYHQMIDTLIKRVVGFEAEENNVYFKTSTSHSLVLERLLRDSLPLKSLNDSQKNLIWKSIDKSDTINFSKELLSRSAIKVLDKKEVNDKIIIGISNAYISRDRQGAVLLVSRAYLYEDRGGHRGGWEEFDFFEKEDKWVLKQSVRYVEY